MKIRKINASLFLLLCLLPFGKNETVNGIIGKRKALIRRLIHLKNPKNKPGSFQIFSFTPQSVKGFSNLMKTFKPFVEEQFQYFQLLLE